MQLRILSINTPDDLGRPLELLLVGPLPAITTYGRLGSTSPDGWLAVHAGTGQAHLFQGAHHGMLSAHYVAEKLFGVRSGEGRRDWKLISETTKVLAEAIGRIAI